jgi:hypothetical protein
MAITATAKQRLSNLIDSRIFVSMMGENRQVATGGMTGQFKSGTRGRAIGVCRATRVKRNG